MRTSYLLLFAQSSRALPSLPWVQQWFSLFQQYTHDPYECLSTESTIPQFLLDTGHPWIVANQERLDNIPDAEAFLCTLSNTITNHSQQSEIVASDGYGKFQLPTDLFQYLKISNGDHQDRRFAYPNAFCRLHEVQRCPRALHEVKFLDINIWVSDDKFAMKWYGAPEPKPIPELSTLFGDVLESMVNLETLKWVIHSQYDTLLEKVFRARGLSLPSVKNLEVSKLAGYLISHCKNVESVEARNDYLFTGHGYQDKCGVGCPLLPALAAAPTIKRVALNGVRWMPRLLPEVLQYIPHVQSLGIHGTIEDDFNRPWPNPSNDINSGHFQRFLDVLSKFTNLTHIDLPDVIGLGIGYDLDPKCLELDSEQYPHCVSGAMPMDIPNYIDKCSEMIAATLPHLKSFSIDGEAANLTIVNGSIAHVNWPWTSRVEEQLLEKSNIS